MLGQLPAFFTISGSVAAAAPVSDPDPAAATAPVSDPDPAAAAPMSDPDPDPDPAAAAEPEPIIEEDEPDPVEDGSFSCFLQAAAPTPIARATRKIL
ncbi:MAG TPA: hypothetical protein VN253_10700 [Kofleriaceae bacterium]|nr:hypothetical protein [Kofleriaceae bacterium]